MLLPLYCNIKAYEMTSKDGKTDLLASETESVDDLSETQSSDDESQVLVDRNQVNFSSKPMILNLFLCWHFFKITNPFSHPLLLLLKSNIVLMYKLQNHFFSLIIENKVTQY